MIDYFNKTKQKTKHFLCGNSNLHFVLNCIKGLPARPSVWPCRLPPATQRKTQELPLPGEKKRRGSLANIALIKMNSGDLPAAEKERANRPSLQEVHRQQLLSPLSDSHTESESAESETETNAATSQYQCKIARNPQLYKAISMSLIFNSKTLPFGKNGLKMDRATTSYDRLMPFSSNRENNENNFLKQNLLCLFYHNQIEEYITHTHTHTHTLHCMHLIKL